MKEDNEQDNGFAEAKEIMDQLNEILCSYQGWGHQSIYRDVNALVVFVDLLIKGEVRMQKYFYEFDPDIYEDEQAVSLYRELAPQTRWRVGRHTQIEPVRMNALKQFASMGKPEYWDYIYYQETDSVLECGEILPYQIFHLFVDTEDIKRLYVFPYPYPDAEGKAAYYSFEPTDKARMEMQKFVNRIYDKIRRMSEGTNPDEPDGKEGGEKNN